MLEPNPQGEGPRAGVAGRVIAGRYELIEPLGKGGMATIWRARHVELGSEAAIKLIASHIADKPTIVTRFKREAKAAAGLNSPYVVTIFDYGVDHGMPYIAMECLHGETLADRLRREGRLTPSDTFEILAQVGRGLEKAHAAGIFHRDLKPHNIFLLQPEHEDDMLRAKLLDFGIAKAEDEQIDSKAERTGTGMMLGSPRYMSPEQSRDAKSVDLRTDVWSLGVVAFECIVGRPPFVGKTVGDIFVNICVGPIPKPSSLSTVPDGFDDWFATACSRDRAVRFPSIAEALRALGEVVGHRYSRSSLQPAGPTDDETVDTESTTLLQPEDMVTIPPAPASRSRVLPDVRLVLLALGLGVAVGGALLVVPAVRHSMGGQPGTAAPSAASAVMATPGSSTTAPPPLVRRATASAEAEPESMSSGQGASAKADSSSAVVSTDETPPGRPGSASTPIALPSEPERSSLEATARAKPESTPTDTPAREQPRSASTEGRSAATARGERLEPASTAAMAPARPAPASTARAPHALPEPSPAAPSGSGGEARRRRNWGIP